MGARGILSDKVVGWLAPSLPLPEPYRSTAFKLSPALQLGIALMLNILSMAVPILMLQVYDRIIPRQAYGTLFLLMSGVLVALVIDAFLRMARAYLMGWTAASHEHASHCAGLDRMTRASMPEYEASRVGTHLQRFNSFSKLREFSSGQMLTALVDLPFVGVFMLLIAYLGGILVLVPIILLGVFAIFSQAAGAWLKAAIEARGRADDRKASFVISILNGIHTVKALGMESLLLRLFEGKQNFITRGSYQVAQSSGFASTLSSAFSQLSLILTVTVGSLLVLNGSLSVGGLSACTLLAGRALQPVQRVLGTWLRMQDFQVAGEHAEDLLTMPAQDRSEHPLPQPEGRVSARHAGFAYKYGLSFLQDVTFEVAQGEVIAISGDKGSGKSTLLQMMAGLLAPGQGILRVDGFDPSLYSMSDLKKHIGYLPQQSTIFKGTILENITGFANDEKSIEEAKAAGRDLGLDQIVDLLPAGYETMLADNAADPVPPGVKQRIALARVFRHKPAILLFDDADRALDKEGYNRLFKIIGRMKGRTTLIMVSHDQNLMSFADRFYHIHEGRLSETETGEVQKLIMLARGAI
ncbi:MAG: ABC transporter transmembrane domain-containing protein [Pseudomonadota bacterium]